MQQKNSKVVIDGVKTPEQEALEKAAQELMLEYNYEFKENIKGILERLEKKIPFKKIDIEHLDLETKIAQNARSSSSGFGQRQEQKPGDANENKEKQDESECPDGIMKDQDYDYCYRNLLIETKEWYTTLKNLSDYLNGKQDPQKNKAKPKKQVKKTDKEKGGNPADDTPQPRCVALKETMDQKTKLQSFKALNFSSETNMGEFMQFLAEHLSFTEKMIHLTILIGDLVEQSIRYTNLQEFENNKKRDEELAELLEQWRQQQQLMDESGIHDPLVPTPNDSVSQMGSKDEIKKPTNDSYKFMHINQLEYFKQNYIKSVSQLIMRMYKSVYSIYKLYPEFNAFEHLSIFDKVYQLQMISHSFGQYQMDNLQELERMQLPQLFDFEEKAQTLLKDGGIKNKDLEIIQKTSREIRDQIDSKLEQAYISHNLWPDFFISSVSFSEIWSESIINDHQPNQKFKFKVGLDVIKMAFQKHMGGNTEGVLSDEAFDLYRSFLPVQEEATSGYKTVKLIDLVNFSDFIEFHQIIKLFTQDQTEACLAQIKNEKSIVQELYNQNFTYQKSQSSGGFVAAASNKNQIDLDGQANNLNQVSDIIGFSQSRLQIAHGGEDGIPGDKQLLKKAVYLRTVRHLGAGDFALMYFMSLFGVRQILNDEFKYALYMNERMKRDKSLCEGGEEMRAYQAKVDHILSKTSGEETRVDGESDEGDKKGDLDGTEESIQEKIKKTKTMAAKATNNMDDGQKGDEKKPKQKRKLKAGMTMMIGESQGDSFVSDFAANDSKSPPNIRVQSSNQLLGLNQQNTLKNAGTVQNVKLKKVQIITEEDEANNQDGKGNKYSGKTGRGHHDYSSQFMKDLTHEDCNLLGLNSLLQVNEVFERFISGEHITQPVDSQHLGANSQMLAQILNGDYGDAETYESVKANPEDLAELQHFEALRNHNSLDDILTGVLQQTLKKIDARLKNQVGETFGNYTDVMKDDEYEGFNPSRDRGYMLFLEGEAEAKFLTNNFIFQKLMQGSQFFNQDQDEPIGNTYRMDPNYPEKQAPKDKFNQYGFEIRKEKPWAVLPCFIPFSKIVTAPTKPETIQQQRILEFFMFRDFSTFLQKSHIKEIIQHTDDLRYEITMPPPDLNTLKSYILKIQKLHFYTKKEMLQQVQQFNIRKIVGKRFYDIFTKLSAISTDGFQREQHVIKIQHWTDEVTKAQLDLLKEEKFVESGALLQQDEQNLSESIQKITTLMINIEKWTAQKIQMEETLKAEEQDWIQNDTIYKQRRIILNYIIKLNLDMSYDAHASLVVSKMNEDGRNLSGQAYELVFFMIQHILQQNRMPSINFMAEINQFINSQQEEMSELNKTQFELTSKVLAIEEEKREMRKKIDEMKQVCDLKETKDSLIQENAAQEIRIAQLRKQLGKGNKAAEPANSSELK